MDVIGVIPARYSSTRFDGKVLKDLLGKSMIQHVWEQAKKSPLLEDLIIACDDERIRNRAQEFGAKVQMTAKGHISGSDRLLEIINPLDVKIVVNIQADEPLVQPSMIDALARELLEHDDIYMTTLIKKINDEAQLDDPNIVKVVIDKDGFALYFSRSRIPYSSKSFKGAGGFYYKHLGIYAYTKDFLFTFRNLSEGSLEKKEKLEQLRVLENGYKIKCIETKYETIGVDTPEDLEKVKNILSKENK